MIKEERNTYTTGSEETFYFKLSIIILGCEHKQIYQGYWFRGMCINCGQYIKEG